MEIDIYNSRVTEVRWYIRLLSDEMRFKEEIKQEIQMCLLEQYGGYTIW